MSGLFDTPDYGEEYDTPMAHALDDAIVRQAHEDAAELARTMAEIIFHTYDPMAPPVDVRMYEGTGIGALYGFADTARFLPELGDWRIVGLEL